MPTVPKSRVVSALLLLLILMPCADVRSADIPLHRALVASTEESEATPRRGPRSLSRREIFQAIQNDLAQKGISGRGELRPGDLQIQTSVPVLQHDMGLQVRKIGFDPIRHETVFELWTSREPEYLPFEVTTRRDIQSLGLASEWAWRPVEAGKDCSRESLATCQGDGRAHSNPPVLAKPGRPATLIMLGENMRITTTVVPLQPGTKGQRILVRDPTTARILAAEVVSEGLLQTSF